MIFWLDVKTWLQSASGLERDALHIYFAVAGQMIAAAIFRRPLSDWRPLLAVLAAALANEALDLIYAQWPDRLLQYGESVHDVINTMLLPTVIMVLLRRARQADDSRALSEPVKTTDEALVDRTNEPVSAASGARGD